MKMEQCGWLQHNGGTKDQCRVQEKDAQTGGDAVGGAQVGRALAPAIDDYQVMPDQRGFRNHRTESPGPGKSDHGADHMNEKDDEVAIPAILVSCI